LTKGFWRLISRLRADQNVDWLANVGVDLNVRASRLVAPRSVPPPVSTFREILVLWREICVSCERSKGLADKRRC